MSNRRETGWSLSAAGVMVYFVKHADTRRLSPLCGIRRYTQKKEICVNQRLRA